MGNDLMCGINPSQHSVRNFRVTLLVDKVSESMDGFMETILASIRVEPSGNPVCRCGSTHCCLETPGLQ